MAFISDERYAQESGGFLEVAPEVVVEVLAPNDRWSDMIRKLREYFAIGVQLVWVADPSARTVLAYRGITDIREFGAGDDLTAEDILPGFAVPVEELFAG